MFLTLPKHKDCHPGKYSQHGLAHLGSRTTLCLLCWIALFEIITGKNDFWLSSYDVFSAQEPRSVRASLTVTGPGADFDVQRLRECRDV